MLMATPLPLSLSRHPPSSDSRLRPTLARQVGAARGVGGAKKSKKSEKSPKFWKRPRGRNGMSNREGGWRTPRLTRPPVRTRVNIG